MDNREQAFLALGIEYAEGIEQANTIVVPSTGRSVYKTPYGWKSQPWNDNWWREFDDLLDALQFATKPVTVVVPESSLIVMDDDVENDDSDTE